MAKGMKKIFITHLTDILTSDKENVGTLRFEGQAVYKWVKFLGSNVVAAGDLVGYTVADTTNLTVDGAVGSMAAGVAMAAVATAGGVQYGWIQVRGVITSSAALAGPPALGNAVKQGTYPAFTVGTAVTDLVAGYVVHVANKIVTLSLPW